MLTSNSMGGADSTLRRRRASSSRRTICAARASGAHRSRERRIPAATLASKESHGYLAGRGRRLERRQIPCNEANERFTVDGCRGSAAPSPSLVRETGQGRARAAAPQFRPARPRRQRSRFRSTTQARQRQRTDRSERLSSSIVRQPIGGLEPLTPRVGCCDAPQRGSVAHTQSRNRRVGLRPRRRRLRSCAR